MEEKSPSATLFEVETVFDVDDYMFAYGDDLTEERTEAEVEGLVRSLQLTSPMKILDLACGFGRHANRLALLGHQVTGIDIMPGFLKIAREEAAKLGVQVDYRQGDMGRIEFQEEFDCILLMFTSFGYFEDEENEQVIRRMARALKRGGRLAFDTMNRDTVMKYFSSGAEVFEKGKDLLINRYSFDTGTGRFQNRRIIIRGGVRKDKLYSIRIYNASEIRAMLERAGLTDIFILGHDGQPLTEANGRRMVVIARKPDADAG